MAGSRSAGTSPVGGRVPQESHCRDGGERSRRRQPAERTRRPRAVSPMTPALRPEAVPSAGVPRPKPVGRSVRGTRESSSGDVEPRQAGRWLRVARPRSTGRRSRALPLVCMREFPPLGDVGGGQRGVICARRSGSWCRDGVGRQTCARIARAWLQVENAEMLALDALHGVAPVMWLCLGTRTASGETRPFYRAREKLLKALRRSVARDAGRLPGRVHDRIRSNLGRGATPALERAAEGHPGRGAGRGQGGRTAGLVRSRRRAARVSARGAGERGRGADALSGAALPEGEPGAAERLARASTDADARLSVATDGRGSSGGASCAQAEA